LTTTQGFVDRLHAAAVSKRSWLCVGLDVVVDRLPAGLPRDADGAWQFIEAVIESTSDLVCAYKPNFSFFEAMGVEGWRMLHDLRRLIPDDVLLIADAKRGDIDSSAEAYARAILDRMGFDAITVNAYGGEDCVAPFLDRADRGVFVWTRSSNPGASEFQDLIVKNEPLYLAVANRAVAWNRHGNCGLVVGATYPNELADVRKRAPSLPILIPGVGAQAGDLEAAVRAGRSESGGLALINASRSVIYANAEANFRPAVRDAAEGLRARINRALTAGLDD
jgi:orotidine-5'-phosphate decarboxylase